MISEIDIRDWQRAEKIVEQIPLASDGAFNNLPNYEDWDFLMKLIEKQLDGVPQVPALFKRPHKYVNEAEKLTPYPEFYEEFSPYNGM